MPGAWPYIIVGLIILLTHFQSGITGFGASALALPFVTLLIGLDRAVPVLVVQAFILSVLMVAEAWRHISWPQYGRMVGLAAAGMPVGMWLARALPEDALRWVLAGFMVLIGVQGLLRERSCGAGPCTPPGLADGAGHKPPPHGSAPAWCQFLLPLGGIIQGAFGTGGPLIVVYATRALTHKTVFRATLCVLWVTLNAIMIGSFIAIGRLNVHLLSLNAAYLPATMVGLWLGNRAHYRIDEHTFRQFVYTVLVLSGAVLAWSLVR